MKHFLFSALILLCCSAVTLIPGKPLAAVTLRNMQVLYIGVDNPVEVQIDGVPEEEINISVEGGSVRPDSVPGRFIVNVNGGTKAVMNVFRRKNGKQVECGSFAFRIKHIPDPVTFVNHVSNDGVILKEDLVKISGVFTRMVNFEFAGRFIPVSFSMSVIEEGEWKEYKATGAALTEEMKTALTKCEEEDKIIFHNVMTKGPAGDVRHVNGVIVTVK
jgi:hypothetical protein